MTKQELINEVAIKLDMSQDVVAKVLATTTETIKSAVRNGHEVYMRGFGTFGVKHRGARKARDIRKGFVIEVPASDVPEFKASKEFRESVNNHGK